MRLCIGNIMGHSPMSPRDIRARQTKTGLLRRTGIKKPLAPQMGNKRSHPREVGEISVTTRRNTAVPSRVGLLARGCRRLLFNALPPPSSTQVEWLTVRDRFSLTVAGPRRSCTGLPSYALAGARDYSPIRRGIYCKPDGCVNLKIDPSP